MKQLTFAFTLFFMLSISVYANYSQSIVDKEMDYYMSDKEPGSIIIKTDERKLYYILGYDLAYVFPIAVGTRENQFFGEFPISRKAKWPQWRPTPNILEENPSLPDVVEGGKRNPLGARAIYLGNSPFRIHGTNNPRSIGKAASHGCIRMYNDDVKLLYQLISRGDMVYVE
jgi:lipoprotein-anchoring transpeptidase ErfK/SrfK